MAVARTSSESRVVDGWQDLAYGPERFAPLHLLRSTPLRVWLLTAVFGLVLAGWSVLVPQFHAPDEPNHTDAVMRLAYGKGWPHPGGAIVTLEGVGAIANSPYGNEASPYDLEMGTIRAQDATDRADRPSWDEISTNPPHDFIQQIVQHPPLYYWTGAVALRLLPGSFDELRWDVVIGTLRLLSALMVLPLPFLAFHGARRLTGDENAATVAAVVPLAVPQLTHIGATVNNDNLLILTAGLATVAVVYVLRGDMTLRTAAYIGIFIGLALFTKSLAIVFVPMAAAAYLLTWRRARRAVKAAAKPTAAGDADAAVSTGTPAAAEPSGTTGGNTTTEGNTGNTSERVGTATDTATTAEPATTVSAGGSTGGAAPFLLADAPLPPAPASALRFPRRQLLLGGTLAFALGGWWWVVNVVRYHTFQPETPGFPPGKYLGDWGNYIDYLATKTIGRWWGAIGWYEMDLSPILTFPASAVVVALFTLAVVRGRGGQARTNLLVLLWPTWALFGLMTYQASTHFAETLHVTGIAGRYLFAGVVALAIGIGAGAVDLPRIRPRHSDSTSTGNGPKNERSTATATATENRLGSTPPRSAAQWLPLVFFVTAVAMQAVTASLTLRHFWQPPGGDTAQAWDAMAAWSPWSPTTLTTVAWLTAAAAAATLVAFIVYGARHPRPNP